MKRLKRFVREARSNSMLGFKRRKQLAAALFAIPLLLFMFAMPFVAGGSGVQAGRGHWSASLELGALNAINGTAKVYLLASRAVSVSVNYSW